MQAPPPTTLKGQKVLVMGLGSFGGGAGCTRALLRLGAKVTVSDLRPAPALQESLASLEGLPIHYVLGEHRAALFHEADVVVVNPAVPSDSKWLTLAREARCMLTTEVNLALAHVPQLPAIAITGTHGKSTCAALCAHLLQELPGTTLLAGNLGGSLLEQVLDLKPQDRMVVELSSFQTERLTPPAAWPAVAVFTSFSADHLDRHGDLKTYAAAKRRLLQGQNTNGTLLLAATGEEAQRWQKEARGKVMQLEQNSLASFGLTITDLPFSEPYRLPSALAALHAARLLGVEDATLGRRIHNYSGLEHRMYAFVDRHGRTLIDNGVATHPDPTAAALAHLPGKVVLVAGGKDKGLNLEKLSRTCCRCARLYLHGEGGRRLAEACRRQGLESAWFENCQKALETALREWNPGETLLFSPTFSSYDEFLNFRERARLFHSLCASVPVGKSEGKQEFA